MSYTAFVGEGLTRASVGTYFDGTGTLRAAGVNVPRITYDPVTLALQGLLLEPATTNWSQNPACLGAAIGTPGTWPTGWAYPGNPGGITSSIVAFGTENGIPYLDVNFAGTNTANSNCSIQMVPQAPLGPLVPVATGQVWSGSGYLRVLPTSTAPLNATITLNLRQQNVTYGLVGNANDSSISYTASQLMAVPSLAQNRIFTNPAALDAVDVTNVYFRILIFFSTVGGVYNFTLRVGATQLEMQPAPTSQIFPSGATGVSTRAADVSMDTALDTPVPKPFATAAAVAETAATSTTTQAVMAARYAVGEVSNTSDHLGQNTFAVARTLSDTTAVADSAVASFAAAFALADALTTSDTRQAAMASHLAWSDTLATGTIWSGTYGTVYALADTVATADAWPAVLGYVAAWADTSATSTTWAAQATFRAAWSASLATSDHASAAATFAPVALTDSTASSDALRGVEAASFHLVDLTYTSDLWVVEGLGLETDSRRTRVIPWTSRRVVR